MRLAEILNREGLMKRTAIFSLLGMMVAAMACAEPVFLPQAVSVQKKGQIEAGVDGMFGYQTYELSGAPGTTFKDRVWTMPVWARYGVTDSLETKLTVPYTWATAASEGNSSTHLVDSGFGNLQVGAKWNAVTAPVPLAVALTLDLPTANPSNNPAALGWRYTSQVQQGFNAHLQLVADTPAYGPVKGHATVGYMNTATYTKSDKVRYNPSDLASYGAGVDMNLDSLVKDLAVSGEFIGYSALTYSRTGGTVDGNTLGTVLEAGPAIRYQFGRIKTHAGVLYDAGKATFRAYNYRVDFGASVLFGTL